MRRRGIVAGRLVLVVGMATGLASCGGDPASDQAQPSPTTQSADATPAVCGALDALMTSFEALRNVEIGQNALPTLSAGLRKVEADVRQFGSDVSAEYADEIDSVKEHATDLEVSVKAASETPSNATINAVGADMRAFGASVRDLGTAVGSTC